MLSRVCFAEHDLRCLSLCHLHSLWRPHAARDHMAYESAIQQAGYDENHFLRKGSEAAALLVCSL